MSRAYNRLAKPNITPSFMDATTGMAYAWAADAPANRAAGIRILPNKLAASPRKACSSCLSTSTSFVAAVAGAATLLLAAPPRGFFHQDDGSGEHPREVTIAQAGEEATANELLTGLLIERHKKRYKSTDGNSIVIDGEGLYFSADDDDST
eukprot:scaffold5400_cov169-Amphora_coffeaeformis.AAC.1